MFHSAKKWLSVLALATMVSTPVLARDLVINFDDPDPNKKAGFDSAVDSFKAANPDVNVIVNVTDREAHKTAIRNFLSADAPDVTAWYPGNRMAPFVNAGQFEDISDLWDEQGFHESLASTKSAMTIDDKQWGVPYTYYQWGIYYRADIFEEQGLEVPQNWEELLNVSATLSENGITPFTIGTKFLWTAAGVFDYLNLRINGYDVHNDLTAGRIKYTDPRIVDVFEHWKQLVEPGYFVENHATMDWEDAMAKFISGEAAMYVMGNFSVANMRRGGLTDDQIDYFPFPEITPGVARAEEAPADAFFIPTNAKNKEDARLFLAHIAQPDVQTTWNEIIGQLPVNKDSSVGDDKFIQKGFETVSTAQGLAQFYDRDAPAEMAKAGMEGFQEFMVNPDRMQRILERLDKVQERVYK